MHTFVKPLHMFRHYADEIKQGYDHVFWHVHTPVQYYPE